MLHSSIRITSVNPVHIRFDVFTADTLHYDEPYPERLTRGLAGSLCIDTKTAEAVILGFPGLVLIRSLVSPDELSMIPEIQQRVMRDIARLEAQP